MRRHIAILLLCCLAAVSCADKLDVLSMLAEDSAVTTYALKKDSFLASTSSLNKHGYSSRQKKHDKHGKYEDEDSYDEPHEGPGDVPLTYGPYSPDYKRPEPGSHNYGPYGTEYEGHKPESDSYEPDHAAHKGHSKHHGKHNSKHHDSYEHEEPSNSTYQDDDGHYVRGLYSKVCLKEVPRVENVFPLKDQETSFQSFFACCNDDAETPTTVGNCNFTATPLASIDSLLPSKVGTVSGTCEFTSPGKCVPDRILNEPFEITDQENGTYWLVVPAALSDKSYDFGVYTAASADADSSKASTTAAQPEAAKPAYSVDGTYEYQTSDDPVDAKRGEAYVFSAMLASQEGLLKGGTIEFIAGFAEATTGNILCPEGLDQQVTPAPEAASGPLPTARCGEYKLKLWWAPEEGPYEGYDGHYQHPHRYYDEDTPEEYHGEEGLYGHGDDEHYSKHDKHSKKHSKHAKYGRKYGKHSKHGDEEYYEPEDNPEGYYNETYTLLTK